MSMTDQPAPTRTPESRPVFESLIADLRLREAKGVETYGDTLMSHNGRNAARDKYEEALDQLVYAHQENMELRDRVRKLEKMLENPINEWLAGTDLPLEQERGEKGAAE